MSGRLAATGTVEWRDEAQLPMLSLEIHLSLLLDHRTTVQGTAPSRNWKTLRKNSLSYSANFFSMGQIVVLADHRTDFVISAVGVKPWRSRANTL